MRSELKALTPASNRHEPAQIHRLEAREINYSFRVGNDDLAVLRNVNISVASGEFIAIIGPSGCGKSTLFSILAGLLRPTAGTVWSEGRDVTGRLGLLGYMLQKDLLLPWKSVLDNTCLGLRLLGVSRTEARRTAREQFPRFGLEGFEQHYPATLSGGMRQRAALLRTFLAGRDVLLLDEPFGALDALTRAEMQQWLLAVWDRSKTLILVTHDVDEAIFLADRVYVMTPRPGSIAGVVHIELPRPRRYENIVTGREFAGLKRDVLGLLKRTGEEQE